MFIQEWMDAWVVIAFFGVVCEPAATLKQARVAPVAWVLGTELKVIGSSD